MTPKYKHFYSEWFEQNSGLTDLIFVELVQISIFFDLGGTGTHVDSSHGSRPF